MDGKIIDGKEISRQIKEEVKQEVEQLKAEGCTPGLAVILVGNDPASASYVGSKERTVQALGMHSEVIRMDEATSEAKLLGEIRRLNDDPAIHGILVQLPLPDQIDEQRIISEIAPEKDVDGFHPVNAGKLMAGLPGFVPCTPLGIMVMLERSGVVLEGKHAVVVGRSNIVGKPMSMLLLQKNATVTVCHSRTADLPSITKQADILVAAVGREGMIGGEHVKEGAVVIDVGINRGTDGKLHGDVDFDAVLPIASKITPVPGGVGPMTIAMLMANTLESARNACRQNG
ncbi:bifunctional methylenetetrahydrofolate dehydrogenase/methenyltetrahydrofolate cyclohydrolase FolD [Edaphobacillus lindanitolerans]|uniref:Bifunctional protein FolD n=1 Tax=Edaphobacillus lindanitolerans TaxID=550447 RepID=A0A1U7PM91_9BACI|nr:bifunctional methylenetetrahydrofolate dehydrogenase/methenyltetrahydrofolate cyclohydrolase FolD [Edaphobacillus lindanitolerans]SIT81701.1 methylenetetrahydrofolate dehydrogenase (NADP+) / methenyltetrahydrofolate cyclohydrolase [Edaphobacillus lindanitolerans]